MANLLREASLSALKDYQIWKVNNINTTATTTTTTVANTATAAAVPATRPLITKQHFETAFKNTKASVPLDERKRFSYVKELLQQNKGALEALRIAKEKTF